jgi:hypothetical protein
MNKDQIRKHATEILLDHARDVEYLSISEHLDDQDLGLSIPEHDAACREIDEAIRAATVTVDWPEADTR